MHNIYLSMVRAAVLTMGLTACANTIETTESTAELPPIEKPQYVPGETMTYKTVDGTEVYQVIANDGERVIMSSSAGCKWEKPARLPVFAPALAFQNCDGSSGTQTITESTGSMWPLTLESEASWQLSGKTDNSSWKNTRACDVDGVVSIEVPAGAFDAYEVVCSESSSTRTWYVAPQVGVVAYTKVRDGQGVEANDRLVSRDAPMS